MSTTHYEDEGPSTQEIEEALDILDAANGHGVDTGVVRLSGDKQIDQMIVDCLNTMRTKGQEYTIGSVDRLANFRTVGEQVGEPMEKVWFTYFYKHYSALVSYIKNGGVKSNETIQSRIMDCIVYLLLFHKMSIELDTVRADAKKYMEEQ